MSWDDMVASVSGLVCDDTRRYSALSVPGSRSQDGYSVMLGLAVCGTKTTKAHLRHQEVFAKIMGWFRDLDGSNGFPVTSLQVSKKFLSKAHRDVANTGPSAIVVFGNFTGGRLMTWDRDDGTGPIEQVIMMPPTLHEVDDLIFFNGNKFHGTENFNGSRFSVVFYCVENA